MTSDTFAMRHDGMCFHWLTAERVMPSLPAKAAAEPAASMARVTVGSIIMTEKLS